MKPEYIAGMLRRLRPVLNNPATAERTLTRYWQERVALIWTIEQVHRAANERAVALTRVEARQILQTLHNKYNPFEGVNWFTLQDLIDNSGKGRRLTKVERTRFGNRDIITIA
jgi:hypothetical protein